MITKESIIEANDRIKSTELTSNKTGKKIGDYVMVNQRIKAFREICPNGKIITEIVDAQAEHIPARKDEIYMRTSIYDENGNLLSVAMAYETRDSSLFTKTSYIEVCETSAVGRALGMLGLGIDASLASHEEVKTADEKQSDVQSNAENNVVVIKNPRTELIEYGESIGMTQIEIIEKVKDLTNGDLELGRGSTVEDFKMALEVLKATKEEKTDD